MESKLKLRPELHACTVLSRRKTSPYTFFMSCCKSIDAKPKCTRTTMLFRLTANTDTSKVMLIEQDRRGAAA